MISGFSSNILFQYLTLKEETFFKWTSGFSILFLFGAVFTKLCFCCVEKSEKQGGYYDITTTTYRDNEVVKKETTTEYLNPCCLCECVGSIAILGVLLIWPLVIIVSGIGINELFNASSINLVNKNIDIAIAIAVTI